MKLTKIAGAFALTAALAMSAVPAFAAPIDATNLDSFAQTANSAENKATAQTEVKASTINANLDCSIPTKVAVVIPSMGGPVQCPTSAVYKITNNSKTSTVKLISVKADAPGQIGLTTATSKTDNFDTMNMVLAAGKATGIQLLGEFQMANLSPATHGAQVGDMTIAPGASMGLGLSGNVFLGKTTGGLTNANLTSALMVITYTIGL